jgi:hypothetical protein
MPPVIPRTLPTPVTERPFSDPGAAAVFCRSCRRQHRQSGRAAVLNRLAVDAYQPDAGTYFDHRLSNRYRWVGLDFGHDRRLLRMSIEYAVLPSKLWTIQSRRVERPWRGALIRDGAVSYFAPSSHRDSASPPEILETHRNDSTHQRPVLSHGRRFRRRTAARNRIPVTIWVAPMASPTPIRAAT